jgi:hypothetical protein
MAQANIHNSTPAPIDSTRRRFLAVSAAASVVSVGTLAAAAMPAPQACSIADDSELLKLEELIFEQHEKATAYDDEIMRLAEIWQAESNRLYQEALAAEVRSGAYLSPQDRWKLVTEMSASIEHNRLCNLQEPFLTKMDLLIEQMFAMPAHTAEGRRAKASVLLGVIMGDDWRRVDAETDHPERMARNLLLEFIGGEPGEMLRGQFA